MTHDTESIFYSDDNHLSIKGAEILNQEILKKISNIIK